MQEFTRVYLAYSNLDIKSDILQHFAIRNHQSSICTINYIPESNRPFIQKRPTVLLILGGLEE